MTLTQEDIAAEPAFANFLPGHKVRLRQLFESIPDRVKAFRKEREAQLRPKAHDQALMAQNASMTISALQHHIDQTNLQASQAHLMQPNAMSPSRSYAAAPGHVYSPQLAGSQQPYTPMHQAQQQQPLGSSVYVSQPVYPQQAVVQPLSDADRNALAPFVVTPDEARVVNQGLSQPNDQIVVQGLQQKAAQANQVGESQASASRERVNLNEEYKSAYL